jgi:hypothetical protein
MLPYFLTSARGSSLASPVITHTASSFLPTSIAAPRSITAEIITFSFRLERTGAYPDKLFCEPKLILGFALRRPNQVHHRGFRHHYAEWFTCSSFCQYPSIRFHVLGWLASPAITGSSALIGG